MVAETVAKVNIRAVAERAGVAPASVSRVLSSHPNVTPHLRERVMAAVREVGYIPNRLAQGLRSGASTSVGFVIGDISNPLMSTIALAAETRLTQNGYALLLANSRNRSDRDAANVALFRQRAVDGLLLSLSDEQDAASLDQLVDFDRPVVLLDREVALSNASRVLFDHSVGYQAVVRHLVGLGHRHLAFLGGPSAVRPARTRAGAILAEAAALGVRRPRIKVDLTGREDALRETRRLLHLKDRPTAVICGSNQLLAGILLALRQADLRIPDDVSLVTTDANDLTELHSPAIACVARDPVAFGTAAADSLLRRFAGGEPDTVVLPTSFVPAGSCTPPA